jgi:hypothetical protein
MTRDLAARGVVFEKAEEDWGSARHARREARPEASDANRIGLPAASPGCRCGPAKARNQ